MSTGDNNVIAGVGDAATTQSTPAAAAGVTPTDSKPSSKPQPFKLPYSNQFDVTFQNVHDMKNKDRIYSDPVTFGPLKWYAEPKFRQRLSFGPKHG